MAFVKVHSLAQLPPGSLTEITAGGVLMALCNFGGEVRAVGGICPHQSAPLGFGAMNGENIVCPWHGWEFSCVTGRNDYDPDTRVATYAVQVSGDDILVDPCA